MLVARKTCVASLVGDRRGKPVNQAGPSGWAVSTGEVQPVLLVLSSKLQTVCGISVFQQNGRPEGLRLPHAALIAQILKVLPPNRPSPLVYIDRSCSDEFGGG